MKEKLENIKDWYNDMHYDYPFVLTTISIFTSLFIFWLIGHIFDAKIIGHTNEGVPVWFLRTIAGIMSAMFLFIISYALYGLYHLGIVFYHEFAGIFRRMKGYINDNR